MTSQEIGKTKFYLSITMLAIALYACSSQSSKDRQHGMRADFRFGQAFYSLCSNNSGEAFVIKGKSSGYESPFMALSSDTSATFHLDSVKLLFERLDRLKSKQMIIDHNMDAPRVEIYYDSLKIYDAHRWDEAFWEIFRPVIRQLPKGFNPFLIDENPFGALH